ncbi:MAG: hypothetical protein V1760_02985 [Candidatus Peregrinibacteria bacterium]
MKSNALMNVATITLTVIAITLLLVAGCATTNPNCHRGWQSGGNFTTAISICATAQLDPEPTFDDKVRALQACVEGFWIAENRNLNEQESVALKDVSKAAIRTTTDFTARKETWLRDRGFYIPSWTNSVQMTTNVGVLDDIDRDANHFFAGRATLRMDPVAESTLRELVTLIANTARLKAASLKAFAG